MYDTHTAFLALIGMFMTNLSVETDTDRLQRWIFIQVSFPLHLVFARLFAPSPKLMMRISRPRPRN